MRYFYLFLIVLFVGCNDAEVSTEQVEANSASHDASDRSDSDPADAATDASQPPDMSRDATVPPADSGPTDASQSDASTDASDVGDAATTDATSPDAEMTDSGDPADASGEDASQPDMSRFVCPAAEYDGQICTQVIVWVRDQESGQCCRYPTACHIPEGNWGSETYTSKSQCSTI